MASDAKAVARAKWDSLRADVDYLKQKLDYTKALAREAYQKWAKLEYNCPCVGFQWRIRHLDNKRRK